MSKPKDNNRKPFLLWLEPALHARLKEHVTHAQKWGTMTAFVRAAIVEKIRAETEAAP